MIMPPLQGKLSQEGFFIYAAADEIYFDLYAKTLVNSVLQNTDYNIHIHIYNPRQDQINFCNKERVSCTYEYVDITVFEKVRDLWYQRTNFANDRQRQMRKKGDIEGPEKLLTLVKQTYFACARFIRLAEIKNLNQQCLSIDVDGLVRKSFSFDLGSADFYLYEKPKDGTHLAGAILISSLLESDKFIQEYALQLKTCIEQDDIYWFLDQFILDQIVIKYKKGLLPMSYVDWAMRSESAIWSAKGKRKELAIFKQEQAKYL